MPPTLPSAPTDGLILAGNYERVIAAPIDRIYENALDWEHLPWLHSETFSSVEMHEAGDWGFRAKVGWQPPERGHVNLELLLNREIGAWVSRPYDVRPTGEIWTYATPAKERTRIDIQFHIPEADKPHAEHFVAQYRALYKRLWDQDEEMSRARYLRLTESKVRRKPRETTLDLGSIASLRARLPLVVEMNDLRYRIVDVDGDMVVHSVLCAHLLGPLEATEVVDGCVTCPWHGYRYDVRSGDSADDHGLKLAAPPALVIDETTGKAELRASA